MPEALERMEASELQIRWERVRRLLARDVPNAGGLMVFAKTSVYYLTGTLGQGVLWLPMTGEPVLMLRRGLERAALESPLKNIVPFTSFKHLEGLARDAGSPLTGTIAAEMGSLPWSLAQSLTKYLGSTAFVPGDAVLALAASVKTDWELAKMRIAGARHHECVHDLLPARLAPGMTERRISHLVWDVFFSRGHMGLMRMGNFGEEIFLGHVSAGDSGNYPSVFNGPLGLRGEHPAIPAMGYAGKVWRRGEPLAVDCGFSLEGYATDKTQVYWAGPASSIPDAARAAQDFCIRVQAYVAESLRPGAVPSAIYAGCLDMAGREGMAEGFMALGSNKVKFVGHGIGLTVDAWPVIAKGFDMPLEAGMVLAVEPKMGIPGLGMVGVENTFEVTEAGGVCMTGDDYGIIPIE